MPTCVSLVGTDPSKINVIILCANRQSQLTLIGSAEELETEIGYLFPLYKRAYGLQYSFLGTPNDDTSNQGVCAQAERAALAILRVDEKFLGCSYCMDMSERLVERQRSGEAVRILVILKKKSLAIDQAPFSGLGTLTLDKPKALASSFLLVSVLLVCNNQYLGEMSLYGWLLQHLSLPETRSKEFFVGSSRLERQESSWSSKQFILYQGHYSDTFEIQKLTDPDVTRLSRTLGAVDDRPHFVKGVAR